MKTNRLLLAGLAVALTVSAKAENWAQWRGPNFNGTSPEKNLPAEFGPDKDLAWSVNLPGPGAATPVVWGDKVFISTTDERARDLQALCFDRKTGKLVWQHKVADGYNRDDRSNYATPSPVTDGKLVVFFYGNGELVGFDMNGEKLWGRNIQKDYGAFGFQWTFSASPLLYEGILYLQVLQRDVPVHDVGGGDSYLLAMKPATGETLWKHVRPSNADAESKEAFSTPIPNTYKGRKEIIIVGGDCLTGHDPKTGEELWRWGTWNPNRITHWRLVPSPVTGAGVVLACAPKGEPIYAAKLGAKGEAELAWSTEDRTLSSDVPTPAFYDGSFFVLSDVKKSISRVDPATGKPLWTTELPGFRKWRSSPTVADGKVYLMNHGGTVLIVDPANGEIKHTAEFGEKGEDNIRSSVVVSQGSLFIRTNGKLFCVGKDAVVAAK